MNDRAEQRENDLRRHISRLKCWISAPEPSHNLQLCPFGRPIASTDTCEVLLQPYPTSASQHDRQKTALPFLFPGSGGLGRLTSWRAVNMLVVRIEDTSVRLSGMYLLRETVPGVCCLDATVKVSPTWFVHALYPIP